MSINWNWGLFAVLWGMGLVGTLAVLPYAFTLQKGALTAVKLSQSKLIALSLIQSGILLGVAAGAGLLAAQSIGLGTPLIAAALAGSNVLSDLLNILPVAIVLGVAAALAILGLEYTLFHPHLPESLRKIGGEIPLWKRALAVFYGGMTEEILMRLFLFSAVAWLLARLWHTPEGMPAVGVFWAANILTALLFGLGHLPATAAVTRLTPLVVVRALVLNGLGGLVFGYLYWQHGLEAAMLAHFSADIVIHVFALSVAQAVSHRATATAV